MEKKEIQKDMLLAIPDDVLIRYVHILAMRYSHAWQSERFHDGMALSLLFCSWLLVQILSFSMLLRGALVETKRFIGKQLSSHSKSSCKQGKPRNVLVRRLCSIPDSCLLRTQ